MMQDTCTRNIHTETHTYTSTRTTARAVRKAFRPLAPNLGTCIIVLSLRALLRNGIVRRVAATRRIRPRESSLRREDGTSLASNEFFLAAPQERNSRNERGTREGSARRFPRGRFPPPDARAIKKKKTQITKSIAVPEMCVTMC